MTKAEHYYSRRYNYHLREFSAPTIKGLGINGEPATPEQAAKHRAERDLSYWKTAKRRIQPCCNGMRANLLFDVHEHDGPSRVSVLPKYVNAHHHEELIIALGGNGISHCPWCGTIITVLPYQDEEYVPDAPK